MTKPARQTIRRLDSTTPIDPLTISIRPPKMRGGHYARRIYWLAKVERETKEAAKT